MRITTVSALRRLTDRDILAWKNTGPVVLREVLRVRDTWDDGMLSRAFGLRGSSWDSAGDDMASNWVGEAEYRR